MQDSIAPFISICIPAYKRPENVDHLLHSIAIQTFTGFEIIITDDSPDDSLAAVLQKYAYLPIRYYKNPTPLGTPANWNAAIAKANGEWIKLMHDDDWFATSKSLELFQNAIATNPGTRFFFSSYANVREHQNNCEYVHLNKLYWKAVRHDPVVLMADNVIGPPSVTLHKNDHLFWYDENVKWVVDMEFYMRSFRYAIPVYIDAVLVNIGINSTQVTNYTFGKPDVQLRENLYLLNKTGYGHLKNIFVFDGWWRLLRNFAITDMEQLYATGYKGPVPKTILAIIQFQKKIPTTLLKTGAFSKMLMGWCYLKTRNIIEPTS